MIELKNATFAYKKDKYIFKDISFKLPKGKKLSILGPNGIGKTTLLKCLTGILQFTEGECLIDEDEKKISYVPQAKKLNISYDVLDFISFGRTPLNSFFSSPKKEDYEISKKMMELLSIEFLLGKKVNEISGGELQLCYMAKALVSDPKIIVLDEPEANLDFKNQKKILETINDLSENQKTTIIMNTHFVNNALDISDYCLLIKNANTYKYGERKEILNEENLRDIYEVPVYKGKYSLEGVLKDAFII